MQETGFEVLAISAGRYEAGVFHFEMAIVMYTRVQELMLKWDI